MRMSCQMVPRLPVGYAVYMKPGRVRLADRRNFLRSDRGLNEATAKSLLRFISIRRDWGNCQIDLALPPNCPCLRVEVEGLTGIEMGRILLHGAWGGLLKAAIDAAGMLETVEKCASHECEDCRIHAGKYAQRLREELEVVPS